MARRWAKSPNLLLASAFAAAIALGGVLLCLPWSQTGTVPVSTLDAFFTAVSAVCVTGLAVVNTPEAFSPFGQCVILLLVEAGGLGIMTFAAIAHWIIGRRLPLSYQSALEGTLYPRDVGRQLRRLTGRILKIVLIAQTVGVVIVWLCLLPIHIADGRGVLFALWSAVFHSVSAFCNAGFSLYSDSLSGPMRSGPLLLVVALLVVVGGLGHWVLYELADSWRSGDRPRGVRRFSLHTRVVLWVSGGLLLVGGLALWACGTGDREHNLVDAFFMSISGRTAGFNPRDMSGLPLPSILILCLLMFVGGAPGSCAGGIKVTGLAIWFARLRSSLRSQSDVSLFGFAIPPELLWKVRMLIGLAVIWITGGTLLLSIVQAAPLETILFEQVSAFATTGLSLGLTPELTGPAQLWIMLSMYVGRVGPLTIMFWMAHANPSTVQHPYGKVMIG